MSSMMPSQQNLPPQGSSFGALWRHPATTQKLLAFALLVASLAVGGFGVFLLLRGSERALYRDLPEQEAATAVERLSTAGVSARLGDDGRSVWVPSGSLDQARLVLARDGLPVAGSAGFELFDETGFGMTDFLEQVNYRRALEGELSRTITALDEVAQARLHLVLPRESVFASESEPAKASVTLRLHRPLAPGNVDAVAHLVASAVEGLVIDNVVIVDSHGRALYTGSNEPAGEALTSDQLALKSKIERELAMKAVAILEPLVGDSSVRAKATVEMDFDRSEETVESYDPAGSVVRSQRREEQLQTPFDSKSLAIGIPGTRSNIPVAGAAPTSGVAGEPADAVTDSATEVAGASPPDAGSSAQAKVTASGPAAPARTSTSETINYEVSKRVRHVSTPTGKVLRRSVAVVVDHVGASDGGADAFQPQPVENMEKFRELVVAALLDEFSPQGSGPDVNRVGVDAVADFLLSRDPDGLAIIDPESASAGYLAVAESVIEVRRSSGLIGAWDDLESSPGVTAASLAALRDGTSLGQFSVLGAENVGPQIGSELRMKGVLAVFSSLIGMLAYIWFRFELRFGIGALVAVVHDVMIVLGLFALADFEFNLTTVAAFLTLIGYSVNDTVVVFDRVRENLRRSRTRALEETMNLSLNQTLSRTVLTSGTTLLALGCLLFLGGDVLRGFAFILAIGIVVGTYSSIYVASPFALLWEQLFGGAARLRRKESRAAAR